MSPFTRSITTRVRDAIVGAIGELCRGLTLLCSYLGTQGLLPPPDLEFTPLEARYAARFQVFGALVQPRVLPLDAYLEALVGH